MCMRAQGQGYVHACVQVRRMTVACQAKDEQCAHAERVVKREIDDLEALGERLGLGFRV